MRSRNSGAQSTCVSTREVIVMVPVPLMAASAPHTGAQGFVRCTTSEGKPLERSAKQPPDSCRATPSQNGSGQRSTRADLFQSNGQSWVNVGNGPLDYSKNTEAAKTVTVRSGLTEKTKRHTESLTPLRLAPFREGWNSTTFAETGSVSTPATWSQSQVMKTCCGEQASKRKMPAKHIATKAIPYRGTTSSPTNTSDAFAGNVLTKQRADTESVFVKSNQQKVESVPVTCPLRAQTPLLKKEHSGYVRW